MHYIVLVLFFAFQAVNRKVGITKFSFYLYIFLLISFAFFAREGSWDYYGYIEYYNCSIDSSCVPVGFEESFLYIARVANAIVDKWGFQITFGFYVASAIWIKLALMKRYSVNFHVALFALLCYGYFIHDLTQIRVSLAIAISWLAYSYWVEKKILLAFLFVAIATFFHVSAILGLVVIVISGVPTGIFLLLVALAIPIGKYIAAGDVLLTVPYERLSVYLNALESEVILAPQFNIYVLIILIIIFIAYIGGTEEWSQFECCGLNSMAFGVALYFFLYYIPAVPIRLLDFFSSLYPFVVAATYRTYESKLIKFILLALMILLFGNTAIKNNTRMDLVFPWQAINIDYMSDIQYEQYQRARE